MSFMPTSGLHTHPMTTSLTHIFPATPSSPAVVGSSVIGSQAKQRDVHVENEQVVGLQSPPQGRPKRTTKAPSCGTGGHKSFWVKDFGKKSLHSSTSTPKINSCY